jgi:hypothetical protein
MAKPGPHNGRYVLDGKIPVPCEDLMEWAHWYETAGKDRIVCKEFIGDYEVSTVFLGLDHSFDDGPPELFETMVFWKGSENDRRDGVVDDAPMYRAPTWELALEMHARAVVWVREQLN